MKLFRLVVFCCTFLLLSGCKDGRIGFVGQFAFDEPSGCSSQVFSQGVNWTDCHKFKRHFRADGIEIVDNKPTLEAFRPLPTTIEFTYFLIKKNFIGQEIATVCSTRTVQTTDMGVFSIVIDSCKSPGAKTRLVAKIYPQYDLNRQSSTGPHLMVRVLWPQAEATQIIVGHSQTITTGDPIYINGDGVKYAMPALVFSYDLPGGEPNTLNISQPPMLNLETRVLLPKAQNDTFNYIRELFSAYVTTLELQDRFRSDIESDSNGAFNFAQMFDTSPTPKSYTLFADDVWANGSFAEMHLLRPTVDPATSTKMISSTATISHEFAHSIQHAYAFDAVNYDYSFAGTRLNSVGNEYKKVHSGTQYQELGVSLDEGVASAMGQKLLNGCNGWLVGQRLKGGANPFSGNMWNGDSSCDNSPDACDFHSFRWHMKKRGIVEGSQKWNIRKQRLQELTNVFAASVGHQFVTSNSEDRVSEMICDLFDTNADTSHAVNLKGKTYVSDFTYWVGEILDGVFDYSLVQNVVQVGTYSNNAVAENVSLNLTQFLDGLSRFCDNGCSLPYDFGHDYNIKRLSATQGLNSSQHLLRWFVNNGVISGYQAANLLRSNFMEEKF